jgi:CTP-dependent riboflavin kinase
MSTEAMSWFNSLRVEGRNGRVILGTLAERADDVGYCEISQLELAEIAEISTRTVMRWLKKFRKKSWLERVRRFTKEGTPDTSGYVLRLPKTEEKAKVFLALTGLVLCEIDDD